MSMSAFRANFKNIVLVTVLAACGMLAFSAPGHAQEERTAGQPAQTKESDPNANNTYQQLNLFGDVFERVRGQYVDEVTDKQLVENAINGMLVALDPHSAYMNEDEFKDMQVQTRGEFGGLGIEVTMENGLVKVVSPIDDTPAFRAGIHAGDYITHLDDQPLVGLTLNDAVDRMRGKVGTTIKLTIRREGSAEPLELSLTRDVIRINSVKHDLIDDSVGYIRITTFNQNTDSGLKDAIADIKKRSGNKLIGYVLDLRNNPGGLLEQAIAVADTFLDKGEIVSTRGRHEEDTKRDNATSGDLANGLPIVTLINGGSASASEIVSGALQDHRRAIIMGTKSFGKGSVQTVIPLPGHGAMRLTTARYYTPSGRSIQAKGIEPDIVVELAKVETLKVRGIRESDLKGALANPDQDENEASSEGAAPVESAPAPSDKKDGKSDEKSETEKPSDKPDPAKDYQLSRAIDLIRGVSLYGEQQVPGSLPARQTPETPETKAPAALPPGQKQ